MASEPARSTYHHGDLAAAALNAAEAIVRAHGHEKLSMRRVAERAGVAHRSLYNHYADKEVLLDAVAARGFLALAARLHGAAGAQAFIAAWVAFSREEPGLYALMTSRPHAAMKDKPDLQGAVHAVITEAMRVFERDAGDRERRRRSVMKVFILIYGALALYRAGVLDLDDENALIAELTAMITEAGQG